MPQKTDTVKNQHYDTIRSPSHFTMSDKRAGSLTDKGSSSHDVRQELPVPIHPDDARDKVFTAIMKALLKLGNKPSSPKELANVIMKYKYATLG